MIKNLFKKRKTALPVKESIETVNTMIENKLAKHGWKYLKSSRKHKKVVGDLSFEICFDTSKWNHQGESIRIEWVSLVNCRKYKIPNKLILAYPYEPLDSKLSGGNKWYDITYKEYFDGVVEDICFQLENSIVLLANEFEKDFIATGIRLSKEGLLYTYDSIYNNDDNNKYISIPFIEDYIGHQYAIDMAKRYVSKYITERASLMQEVDAYKRNQPLSIYLSCNEIFVIRHFDEIMKI